MMLSEKPMDETQSGQKVGPPPGENDNQQSGNDPSLANSDRENRSVHTVQSRQAGQQLENKESGEMNTGEPAQSRSMENPQQTKNIIPGEIPGKTNQANEVEIPWFNRDELEELHSRWTTIQIQFVEDPCSAVEQCEAMVAETIERVKQMISDQQHSLGQQWLSHDEITTEELRLTLLNYRSLLNRLLKI